MDYFLLIGFKKFSFLYKLSFNTMQMNYFALCLKFMNVIYCIFI